MKRTFLQLILGTSFLLLIGLSTSAQDVGIARMVYPEDNQRVHLQYTYPIDFVLKNYGSTSVQYKDISFDMLYDKQFWQTYGMGPTGTLAPGDSVEISIPALTIATANSTIEICIATKLNGDNNANNDTVCNLLYFSLDSYLDLKPVLVRIISPLISDSTIGVGTKVIQMEGYIKNVGNVTLPKNYTVLMRYSMYTKNRTFAGSVTSSLDTAGLITIKMIGGLPTVQNSPGPFNVCINILNSDDKDVSNNEYCQTFYAIDFTGIGTHNKEEYNSYAYKDNINIIQPDDAENIQIRIHNSSGQLVYLNKASARSGLDFINLGHLGSGVYIIDITDKTGQLLHTNKFVLD